MKTFFVVLAVVSTAFIGNVEGVQQRSRVSEMKQAIVMQAVVQAANNERQALLNNCATIRAVISERFIAAGAANGSGHRNAVKAGITDYLNSVGTPAARQLLKELQANGFQGFI